MLSNQCFKVTVCARSPPLTLHNYCQHIIPEINKLPVKINTRRRHKHLHDKPFISLIKKSDDIESGKDSSPACVISVIVCAQRAVI